MVEYALTLHFGAPDEEHARRKAEHIADLTAAEHGTRNPVVTPVSSDLTDLLDAYRDCRGHTEPAGDPRDAELERLRMAAAAAESRADMMLKAIARVRSMADAWRRQFPDAAWSGSAREAVYIATDIKGVTS